MPEVAEVALFVRGAREIPRRGTMGSDNRSWRALEAVLLRTPGRGVQKDGFAVVSVAL